MNDKDTKKEITPAPSTGSLISFDDIDNFFDDFMSRRRAFLD